MSHPSRRFVAPERVVTRGRHCGNCASFENGEKSRQLWRAHYEAALGRIRMEAFFKPLTAPSVETVLEASKLAQSGVPDQLAADIAVAAAEPQEDARVLRLRAVDREVASGCYGICMKGKPGTDFIYHTNLCESWSGKTGHSLATGGKAGKLDKLSDELKDIADSKVKKI